MTDTKPPEGALTDDEFRELGRTMGTLVHRILRLRSDNEMGTISVLSTLTKCGPARASDLARDLVLDLSTVSRHVQSLEKSGLVEKAADPTDRRAMTLHVTAEGKDYIERLWDRKLAQMREGLAHWEPEDLRTLTRLMGRYAEDYLAIAAKHDEHHEHRTKEADKLKTGTDS
jgi:DNA-binding MarR family transcriptional regulator